jgi:uncharacterized protein YbbK (DUF523 family)
MLCFMQPPRATKERDGLPLDIRVGISSCLLGQMVRYDGSHKLEASLIEWLQSFCRLVPVCPEVELGLGVPREPIRLCGSLSEPRLVSLAGGIDLTEAMRDYTARRLESLDAFGIAGFVLKSRSPSCGLGDVPVLTRNGAIAGMGDGAFAAALLARFPLLPLDDERRLQEPERREEFRARVLAFHRRLCERPRECGQ